VFELLLRLQTLCPAAVVHSPAVGMRGMGCSTTAWDMLCHSWGISQLCSPLGWAAAGSRGTIARASRSKLLNTRAVVMDVVGVWQSGAHMLPCFHSKQQVEPQLSPAVVQLRQPVVNSGGRGR
jgi:hypothetical protein